MQHVLPPISLVNIESKSKKSSPIKGSHLKTFGNAGIAKQAKNYDLFFKIITHEK